MIFSLRRGHIDTLVPTSTSTLWTMLTYYMSENGHIYIRATSRENQQCGICVKCWPVSPCAAHAVWSHRPFPVYGWYMYRVMFSVEYHQEAESVGPDYPARTAQADPTRCFTHMPLCWFSRDAAHIWNNGYRQLLHPYIYACTKLLSELEAYTCIPWSIYSYIHKQIRTWLVLFITYCM